jgi:branched-chain amino acid transport system substrate-binding protein
MSTVPVRLGAFFTTLALVATLSTTAFAQKKYDPGASDTEIKIGNTMPYSGPLSAYGIIGKTEEAYFRKINAEGGINRRKIDFISYDDGYSPPKTVEQARRLVESDEVLLIFNSVGTAPNLAIQRYMTAKKVPQLFAGTGSAKFDDPKNMPWTMGWQLNYQSEALIYAKYLLDKVPNAKIAVLYQNDDFGKDNLKGLKDGLGAKAASMIVVEDSYEVSEPTIDSHIVKLKASGADVFFDMTSPKFAAQAIKKSAEIGWKPIHILSSVSASIGSVIKPAGFENAQDVISSAYLKDPTDPHWRNDSGLKAWNDFLDKYYPDANRADISVIYGYTVAQNLVQVLKNCGDDLTRANVMKQAAAIKDLQLDGLLPGVQVNTSATDFAPISQLQLKRLKGETWELFGDVIDANFGG